jgi:uncharacterized GH25 family protein
VQGLRAAYGVILALFAALPLQAHEFWMRPDRFDVETGERVRIALYVGQNFAGERVGIAAPLVARLSRFSVAGSADLAQAVPARGASGDIAVTLPSAGTHLVAMDTNPSAIVLPADAFNAYLELEGLQDVIDLRAKNGAAATPGRERYRRNVKTLVNAGGRSDGSFSRRTGQRLEIVPLADPYAAVPGQPLAFQVFFDAKPLAHALVKFWSGAGDGAVRLESRTDGHGAAQLAPPRAGVWMASVVHMIPASDSPEFDWDSYWGNLTFALRDQAEAAPLR